MENIAYKFSYVPEVVFRNLNNEETPANTFILYKFANNYQLY